MVKPIVNERQIKYVAEHQPVIRPKVETKKIQLPAKNDKFLNTNPKMNLRNALRNGSLVHNKPTKLFGIITLRRDYYEYTPAIGETAGDIKQKFGIKDGVIKSLNSIYDDDYCPAVDNKTVIFTLDD